MGEAKTLNVGLGRFVQSRPYAGVVHPGGAVFSVGRLWGDNPVIYTHVQNKLTRRGIGGGGDRPPCRL